MPNFINNMMMAQLEKEFAGIEAAVFVSLQGLTVEESNNLRANLSEFNVPVQVVKNRIAVLALEKAGVTGVEAYLKGATAVAYGNAESAIHAAKVFAETAKTVKALQIKGAFLDGQALDKAQTLELATIPSREGLYSMILGGINSLLSAPAALVNQVLSQPVYLANAYVGKKE